jgi:hypothetical protein
MPFTAFFRFPGFRPVILASLLAWVGAAPRPASAGEYRVACASMLATAFRTLTPPPRNERVLVGVVCSNCVNNALTPADREAKLRVMKRIVRRLTETAAKARQVQPPLRVVMIGDTGSAGLLPPGSGVEYTTKNAIGCDFSTLMMASVTGGDVAAYQDLDTRPTQAEAVQGLSRSKASLREPSPAEGIDEFPGALIPEGRGASVDEDTPPSGPTRESKPSSF